MLAMAGFCAGQPFKYQQLAELFSNGAAQDRTYARPLSFGYMNQPMADVQVAEEQPANNFQQRMVGQEFFKSPVSTADDDVEEVPYNLIKDYGAYEHREYPSANFACVKAEVDTDNDVLAGLEDVNPLVLMSSKRYRKSPSSIMFMELFKYISGVNKENEEVKMTKPVSTLHDVMQKKFGGEVELQEMCFYVPAIHQSNPPQPLDKSPVYIKNRPTMKVYARRFGGYVLTADAWKKERDLLATLIMGKPHHDNEYYTNGYNSPFVMHNRRNEVWIQDLKAGPPVIAAVQAEMDDDMPETHEHHKKHDNHKKQHNNADEDEIEPQPEVHVPFEQADIPKKASAAKPKNKKE